MVREVACPFCKKVIGKRTTESAFGINGIPVALCREKIDYRKASRVLFPKKGRLCRKCARERFPEGFVYYVTDRHDSIVIAGGDYGGKYYKTKMGAETARLEISEKKQDFYYVKSQRI